MTKKESLAYLDSCLKKINGMSKDEFRDMLIRNGVNEIESPNKYGYDSLLMAVDSKGNEIF